MIKILQLSWRILGLYGLLVLARLAVIAAGFFFFSEEGIELAKQLSASVFAENLVKPARVRLLVFGSNNFDDIALLEFGAEADHFAIYNCAGTGGANVAMETIGEIERHGTFRQVDNVTLWRIDENLIGKEVKAEFFSVDFFALFELGGCFL